MSENGKEKVFVGVLANSGMVHISQMLLAYHLPFWSASPDCPYEFAFYPAAEKSPQPYKRNKIIAKFLRTDCDVLMQIDDDMIVDGKVLDLLATPDYDIVGPIQLTMKGTDPEKGRTVPECFPCAFMKNEKTNNVMTPIWPGTMDYAPVDIVGSGVIAIKRYVLEDPRMRVDGGETKDDVPAFFRDIYQDNGRRTRGLDVDFCLRARELGYRVVMNWKVEVGHFKTINLNDVETYAKAMFAKGVEMGRDEANEIPMEEGQGRPDGGPDREAGRGRPGDEGVAGQRLDRAARRRRARDIAKRITRGLPAFGTGAGA